MQFLILFLRCHTRETTARGFPRTAVQVSHDFNLFQVRVIIERDATPLANLDYMRAHDQSQGSTPPFFSFGGMAYRHLAPVSDFVVRRSYRASSASSGSLPDASGGLTFSAARKGFLFSPAAIVFAPSQWERLEWGNYRPLNSAGRFSKKACTASLWSSVIRTCSWATWAKSNASSNSMDRLLCTRYLISA